MSKEKLRLTKEETRPCACGAGDHVHRVYEYDVENYSGDWPGLVDEWEMRCRVCREVYADRPQSFAGEGGAIYRWPRREDAKRWAENFEATMRLLRKIGSLARSRYSKRWHAHFEGRSELEIWKALDHPDNVQRKTWEEFEGWVKQLGLKTVLDAHFIQGNYPFILSVLGATDPAIEARLAKYRELNAEANRLWALMRENSFF